MSHPRTLVICTGERCGSELLCDLLRINVVSFPREHFRPDLNRFGAALASSQSTEAYLSNCRASHGYPVFGTKLFSDFLPLMRANMSAYVRRDADMLPILFPGAVYVSLTRSDRLGVAISLARAVRSGNWSRTRDEACPPVTEPERAISARDIHEILCERLISNHAWLDVFSDAGLDPIRLDYADLVGDPASVIESICAAVGVRLPGEPDVGSRLVRQADALTEALRTEYLAAAARATERVARSGGFQ